VFHITYDNYTSIGKMGPAKGGSAFPTHLALTVAVLPFTKIQLEVGIDWMEPTDYPLFFNAKLGSPEGVLFKGSPALEVGIFNAGTKKGITDQNIAYFVTGRSLPAGLGRLHLSGYVGNGNTLKSSTGQVEKTGYMVGYDRGFVTIKSPEGEYTRFVFAGDYASGKNAIGGGGVGLYTYYTKNISILSGPVWFNDKGLNGGWKWTTQLDVNF